MKCERCAEGCTECIELLTCNKCKEGYYKSE